MLQKILFLLIMPMTLINPLFGQSADWPAPRSGHSMVVMDSVLYIFGGEGNVDGLQKTMSGPQLNDLWKFSDNSAYAEEKPYDPPEPRSNHCCYKNEKDPWFYVHGGKGEQGPLDDMYLCDGGSWGEIGIINVPPEYVPRYSHTINEINNQRYILGGLDKNGESLSDFWKNGVQDGLFRMTPLADFPKRIAEHGTMTVDDDHLLVFGGGIPDMNTYYNEAWIYTISADTWELLTITGDMPPAVYGFSMTSTGNQTYLIGGETETGMNRNLYQFELNGNILESVNLGDGLQGRFNYYIDSQIAYFPNEQTLGNLLVFGGKNLNNEATNKLLSYDIATNRWAELTESGWENISTGVNNAQHSPSGFKLCQNYPNPFNPTTMIKYSLSKNTYVNLTIINSAGKVIDVLVNNNQAAGNYNIQWDAREMPSGIYFYKISTNDFSDVKKCLLIK